MRQSQWISMLFGALLLLGFGASNLSAMEKCGAGKCGHAVPAPATMKCGAGKCGAAMQGKGSMIGCACGENCDNPKCAHKLDPTKPCDCNQTGKMKCGAGKCGAAMQKAPAMKCGAGKCGQ